MIKKLTTLSSLLIVIVMLLSTFTLFSFHSTPEYVEAASDSLSLTIKKYIMTDSQATNTDIFDQAHELDNQGLEPLSGAVYRIVRVEPTDNWTGRSDWHPSHYVATTGSLLFDKEITTDENGVATLGEADGLVSGYYLITEEESDRIPNPMAPVVVSLPMVGPDGTSLVNNVVVYPKSGVVTPKPPTPTTPTPPTTPPTTPNVPPLTEIPQTSGSLTGQWSIIGIFTLVLGLGLLPLVLSKSKKRTSI